MPPILDKARGTADRKIFVFGEAETATRFAPLLESDGDARAAQRAG